MTKGKANVNWKAWLGDRLPAIIGRLRPSQLMLLAGRAPSTEQINVHAHPELCAVVKGRVEISTSGDPLRLRAGDVLLVAPRMYHEPSATGRSADMLWVSATPNHMGCSLARVDTTGLISTLGGIDFLTFEPGNRALTRVIGECLAKRQGWLPASKALLALLLVEALRRLDTDGRVIPPSDEWSAAEIVTHEARLYIQRNYRHDLALRDVADHVALSSNYLASLFKRQFSQTIIDFLTEVRIEEAKQLLADTDRKVAEIAERVGYHSPYYFSRAFKKVVGCSPKAYRESTWP